MGEFLMSINWTAVVMTFVGCHALQGFGEVLLKISRIWLDGIKTQLAIEQEISRRWGGPRK